MLRGSQGWLSAAPSPASQDLVSRARTGDQPLHVLTIGAPTNVATALQAAPDIAERIVVVWLGGNPWYWHKAVIAWLVDNSWVPTAVVHSPLLTDAGTWSHDPTRHLIREALWADRDTIFADFFRKLHDHA